MQVNKLKTHQKIFLFSVILVSVISLLDLFFMSSNLFASTQQDYITGNYTPGLWDLFFKIGLVLIVLSSLGYYWFRKDKSEALSIFISSILLWMIFGLSDLIFFIFQGKNVPSSLPWLNGSFIGKISTLLGFSQVTNISLYLCVILGLGIIYIINKFLVNEL